MHRRILGLTVFLATAAAIPTSAQEPVRNFMWKQCNEDVLIRDVDPEPFLELAGDEFSLAIEDGRVRMITVVQDCPTYRFNGEELGATQEIHQWIAIVGPGDIRTVTGAEQTLPTMSWLAVFTGSNNPQVREHWIESGTPSSPIVGASLDPAGAERGGSVNVGEGLEYSWSARSSPPIARLLGVNHDVYVRGVDGGTVYNRIECLGSVYAWASPATLTVRGGTYPGDRIGPGEHQAGVHTFLPLWCRATLADTETGTR